MNDFKIAGLNKASDWQVMKYKLVSHPTEELWQQAFNDFLVKRVRSRYFEPIEAIENIKKQQGKGFSIIAIYCSLIEFFESLLKGYYHDKNYKYFTGEVANSTERKNKKGKPEPLNTEEVFIHFLTENEPFKGHFTDKELAKDFYKHVRCSILHQAETTGGWIIRDGKEADPIFEKNNEIITLHWKPLKRSFELFLKAFGVLLTTDMNIQKNFLSKWDKISNL